MPAVRTDRCPHCWAALAPDVGPACPHCRKSLVPAGKKAQQAYEQERHSRAGTAAPQPPAPQSTHPRRAEPPKLAPHPPSPASPPPQPSSFPADPAAAPALGDPAAAPALGEPGAASRLFEPAAAPVWGAPNYVPPGPPAARSGRRPVVTALMVVGALLGIAGGGVAGRAAFRSVFGTKASHSTSVAAPADYDGPTFSVRLPGRVEVQHVEQSGIALNTYMAGTDDVAVAVIVSDLPAGAAFDFKGAAQGIVANAGGRIASDHALDVAGRPAHDLVLTGMKGGQATGWWRVILDESRLYQVSAVAAGDQTQPPASYITALDSFTMR